MLMNHDKTDEKKSGANLQQCSLHVPEIVLTTLKIFAFSNEVKIMVLIWEGYLEYFMEEHHGTF